LDIGNVNLSLCHDGTGPTTSDWRAPRNLHSLGREGLQYAGFAPSPIAIRPAKLPRRASGLPASVLRVRSIRDHMDAGLRDMRAANALRCESQSTSLLMLRANCPSGSSSGSARAQSRFTTSSVSARMIHNSSALPVGMSTRWPFSLAGFTFAFRAPEREGRVAGALIPLQFVGVNG